MVEGLMIVQEDGWTSTTNRAADQENVTACIEQQNRNAADASVTARGLTVGSVYPGR